MTAIQMALDHPGNVHAALAIHPNESVLHGHRGVPGPDGLPLKYKPYHDTSFEDALAEVHRLATTYPEQVVAIGETGMDLFRTGEGAKELQREAFRAHIALAKELGLPCRFTTATPIARSSKPCWPTARPNAPYSTRIPATVRWPRSRANMAGI